MEPWASENFYEPQPSMVKLVKKILYYYTLLLGSNKHASICNMIKFFTTYHTFKLLFFLH